MAAARLIAVGQVPFNALRGYRKTVDILNALPPRRGFMWRQYSPASFQAVGVERRYFTRTNACRIDAIRKRISEWRESDLLTDAEHVLLIADLLSATNRVANIAGTYGCFLSRWTPQSQDRLEMRCRSLRVEPVEVVATTTDASNVLVQRDDFVYLDPPYTKRQYASYYHILETITLGDQPRVEGVAGLRPWRHLASAYCYKVQALKALRALISGMASSRILLSYSAEAQIPIRVLKIALSELGLVSCDAVQSIGRYRPNPVASHGTATVKEYLLTLRRDAANSLDEIEA